MHLFVAPAAKDHVSKIIIITKRGRPYISTQFLEKEEVTIIGNVGGEFDYT